LNTAFLIVSTIRLFTRKSKRKVITNSEKDIMRYIQNLTVDNILEMKEAQLVQAAFKFDDLLAREIMISRQQVICLTENMEYEELKNILLKYSFDCYPVLNKNQKVYGVFDCKLFYRNSLDNVNTS
jgi:CBS domain containing-hemolysin-like protein